MKKQEVEYQHFIFEHNKTHEEVQFKIGPAPIAAMDFEKQVKQALKDLGKDPDGNVWTVKKAWSGPEGSNPPERK